MSLRGGASPGSEASARGRTDSRGTADPERQTSSTSPSGLVARIDALGALVRSESGIVAVRLRNSGGGESGELVADVGLPGGVTLLAGAKRGRATAVVTPVGTVDGWSCRIRARGARCIRGPLAAGRATAVFLRVLVSAAAVEGSAPSVTVSAEGSRMTARSSRGVRITGAPARFATDGQVVTSAIGNTLLSCAYAGSVCSAARSRTSDRRDNNHWAMRPFDQDGDPSTANSSAAQLLLPRTSKLVWAGLYWSGSAPSSGQIKFRAPGDERYRQVKAARVVERELPAGRRYQAFADVTRLVDEVRGTYWVADASLRPGVSQHAGWSLVIIAADPSRPYSQAVVVDTATVLDGKHRSVRIPLDGLTSTGMPARVALVTWEGDAAVRGDRVTLGGHTLRPDSGDRDQGNPFDGSATGARDTSMTFGTDVDGFQATLGRDPALTVSTRQDVLLFGAAVVSVQTRP
jgi:hypothetical protein